MLNMYYIPDFIQWKLAQGYKKINPWPLGAGLLNFHFVYHPAHLNVKVFPLWMKEKIAAKYEAFYKWLEENHSNDPAFLQSPYGIPRLQGMVRFMMSEDWVPAHASNSASILNAWINCAALPLKRHFRKWQIFSTQRLLRIGSKNLQA
jgi:hypothetical protein